MPRWFLSYHSPDQALAERLKGALEGKDPDGKTFLAPKHLRVGGFWLPVLAREIAEATAFVMLVGANGIGPWQVIEYYEAIDRRVKEPNFPVVLVLLDGQPAPGLPFLRQLHWIITADPGSKKSISQLLDATAGEGAPPGELWRHTAPYRGLAAMTEADSDFFFGRERETVEVIKTLAGTADKLPILLGNSGVGKSSLAQAGVLASFMRRALPQIAGVAEPWPGPFNDSRKWCVIKLTPGTDPIRALVEPFIRTWLFDPTDPRRETRANEWAESLLNGNGTFRGLLNATEDRLQEQGQSRPPAFLLYIDQGEELYVRTEERKRRRFSDLIAQGLADPRLRALMSLRADFFGELQKDEPLYAIHRQINVPPLREAQLQEVISRPATILDARFDTDRLAPSIAKRSAEESIKDAGALPLLSYLLDNMWRQMVRRGDGVLRLPEHAIELGAVLVDRADAFLTSHGDSEERLRRILTLKLATVREDGEPTRRRALRSEFSDDEWRLVSELANDPYRLLVTVTPEAGETYAEVSHEAIFRRWDRLREWITTEREFLTWRNELEAVRRRWQATGAKEDALLMGLALAQAKSWVAKRPEDTPKIDREFIDESVTRDMLERKQKESLRLLVIKIGGAALAVTMVLLIIAIEQWQEARNNEGTAKAAIGDIVIAVSRLISTDDADKQIDIAISAYSEAIRLLPNYASAYRSRADAYLKKGDLNGAIQDYTECIKLNPENLETHVAYLGRGIAYAQEGELDSAIRDYSKSIELDPQRLSPDWQLAYVDRGIAYMSQSDFDNAIADFDRLLAFDPKSFYVQLVYFKRGTAYAEKGNLDQAIADYTQSIQLKVDFPQAFDARGFAYLVKDDLQRAIADYDRAILLDPKFMHPLFGRGIANLYVGAPLKALADLQQAAELDPKAPYVALWLEIVSRRTQLASRLSQAIGQIDMAKWPAPVIQLFVGQTTPAAVLAAAEDPDPGRKRGQLCEANFYIGALALQQGATGEATRLFRLAATDCPRGFNEWSAANQELKLLGASP